MITLEEVKKIYTERLEAIEWAQKWSPYALLELEQEYEHAIKEYATQEGITTDEVVSKLS